MTDQNNSESGKLPETTAMPTPQFEGASDERTSIDVEAIASALKGQLTPWLESELSRRLQSEKDRRIVKLEGRVGDFDARLARYDELLQSGQKPDQARQQLQLEEAIEFLNTFRQQAQAPTGVPAPQPVPGSADKEQAIAEANQLLHEAGLENDPGWVEVLRTRKFKDGADYLKAAAQYVIKRSTATPPPNPALTIQPGGGSLPRPDLEAQYKQEMYAAKGSGNYARAREIKDKYRSQGLDVDSIPLPLR